MRERIAAWESARGTRCCFLPRPYAPRQRRRQRRVHFSKFCMCDSMWSLADVVACRVVRVACFLSPLVACLASCGVGSWHLPMGCRFVLLVANARFSQNRSYIFPRFGSRGFGGCQPVMHIIGSIIARAKRCVARFGLHAVRIGEASHPGPSVDKDASPAADPEIPDLPPPPPKWIRMSDRSSMYVMARRRSHSGPPSPRRRSAAFVVSSTSRTNSRRRFLPSLVARLGSAARCAVPAASRYTGGASHLAPRTTGRWCCSSRACCCARQRVSLRRQAHLCFAHGPLSQRRVSRVARGGGKGRTP